MGIKIRLTINFVSMGLSDDFAAKEATSSPENVCAGRNYTTANDLEK
jgi:hypothetical protein